MFETLSHSARSDVMYHFHRYHQKHFKADRKREAQENSKKRKREAEKQEEWTKKKQHTDSEVVALKTSF